MPWLRDGIAARGMVLGDFCRQAVAHPAWSAKPMGARTLENRLRAHERGSDPSFIEHRPFLVDIVAQLLGLSLDEVRRLDQRHRGLGDDSHFELADVPGVRFPAAQEDALPPLWPELCLTPERWRREWWNAEAGSGRSMLAHVLRSLGRIGKAVELTSTGQFEEVLRAGAPRFVEIADGALAQELEPELARCEGILVAAPLPPPMVEGPHEFESSRLIPATAHRGRWIVHSVHLDRMRLESILRWLGRFTSDQHMEVAHDAARDVLLDLFDSGDFTLRVAGDVLSAYGILCQVGVETFLGAFKGRPGIPFHCELVQLLFRAREGLYDDCEPGSRISSWLRWLSREGHGSTAVEAMVRGSLGQPAMGCREASAEHWASALREVAVEGEPLGERAADLVATLVHIGVLRRVGSRLLTLRPPWLVRVVQPQVLAELLAVPERESWSVAIAQQAGRQALAVARQECLAGRFDSVWAADQLAEEAEASGDPERQVEAAAAVGLAARALGLAVLQGGHPFLPTDTGLYEREMASTWQPPDLDLPGPLIRFVSPEEPSDQADTGGPTPAVRTDLAIWLLAMMGLSSLAKGARRVNEDPLLAPCSSDLSNWTDGQRARMGRALGYVSDALEQGQSDDLELQLAVEGLARLLVERAGHCIYVLRSEAAPGAGPYVQPLLWPAAFARLLLRSQGRPSPRHLDLLALPDIGMYPALPQIHAEVEHYDAPSAAIIPALFRLWERHHRSRLAELLHERLVHGELELLTQIDPQALGGPLGDALLRVAALGSEVHARLAPEEWLQLLRRSRCSKVAIDWAQLCERIPLGALPVLLAQGLLAACGQQGSGVLWRRFPFELTRHLREALWSAESLDGLLHVLALAPPSRLVQLAGDITVFLRGALLRAQERRMLSSVLVRAVDLRPKGWPALQVALLESLAHAPGDIPAARAPTTAVHGSGAALLGAIRVRAGAKIELRLAGLSDDDHGVLVVASEVGFSPLGSRLRHGALRTSRGMLAPLAEAMRYCEHGPLLGCVRNPPGSAHAAVVLVQTDRGPWFESAYPRGTERWTKAVRAHYRRMMLAVFELVGRISSAERALTLAHPIGHGWPDELVAVVVNALAEAAEGASWAPEAVWLDRCCVRDHGRAFSRALDARMRHRMSRRRPGFALESLPLVELGLDLGEPGAVELYSVREE